MKYNEFVRATICSMNQKAIDRLKQMIAGEYILFSIIDYKDVTTNIFAEKICDYFATAQIRTGKSFDKLLDTYMSDLDSIVGSHVTKAPQAKKDEKAPIIIPRARKYYDKAIKIKNNSIKNPSITQLIDYSRIMMCLYAAVQKNDGKPINNFDFSIDCLAPEDILETMKNEEVSIVFPPSKKKKFETKDRYCDDVCTLIISAIILCAIVDRTVEGETEHE